MNRHRHLLACVFAVLGATATCNADEVSIQATKDNTLFESPTGALSNGMGRHFFAGTASGSTAVFIRRGLLSFDVSAHIPATATIDSATLTLHVSRVPSNTKVEDMQLHRLLADWGEGASMASGEEGQGAPPEPNDATWIHSFFDRVHWQNAGGDFDATHSASTPVDGIGFYSWSSAAMAADVQSWIDDPASNFGWVLRGNEAILRTGKRFDSLQNLDPTLRPVLDVTFTPCVADCDASGELDIFDFLCFQSRFGTGEPGACDCDTSTGAGVCDIFDFLCFQSAFVSGCP